jgi:hypothetical protein
MNLRFLKSPFATPCRRGLLIFGLLALPVLAAIWGVPWFVTQDGPLHLLNAHIMTELLKQPMTFDGLYAVRWDPLPYWAAHLCLSGLMSLFSDRTADRILMTLTSMGLASAIVWLRWRVAGWEGMWAIAPLAVILSLNILWLLGLYSFLLGAGLMLVTLGVWWMGRNAMGPGRALIIALLLVAGYLTHLVSVGLTAISIVILALGTPGRDWWRRNIWTAASLAPLVPLALIYHRMMRSGGAISPSWYGLDNIWSPVAWFNYARTVDFVLLRPGKELPPFAVQPLDWFGYFAPTTWLMIAVAGLGLVTLLGRGDEVRREKRGWIILSLLLFLGALMGPYDFGGAHGTILRERILLLAMATSAPALTFNLKPMATSASAFWFNVKRWSAIACGVMLLVAAAIQIVFVWDYALFSNRLVSDFMAAKPYVGTGQRIEALQIDTGGSYCSNPVHNLPSALGIGNGNVVWNNYGPCLYYFPVKFSDDETSRRALRLSDVSVFHFKNPYIDESDHVAWWKQLLEETHDQIDTLVVAGSNAEIDRINAQWYGTEPVFQNDSVKVFRAARGLTVQKEPKPSGHN